MTAGNISEQFSYNQDATVNSISYSSLEHNVIVDKSLIKTKNPMKKSAILPQLSLIAIFVRILTAN